jgi:hypothetical protein
LLIAARKATSTRLASRIGKQCSLHALNNTTGRRAHVGHTAKTADKFGLRADEQAALFLASVK